MVDCLHLRVAAAAEDGSVRVIQGMEQKMEQNQTSQTKQVFGQKDGTEGNEAIRQDFLCAVGKGQDVRAKLRKNEIGSTNWL